MTSIENLFAYTGRHPSPYPGYLSVNRDEAGNVAFTVRTEGNNGHDLARVVVPDAVTVSRVLRTESKELNLLREWAVTRAFLAPEHARGQRQDHRVIRGLTVQVQRVDQHARGGGHVADVHKKRQECS